MPEDSLRLRTCLTRRMVAKIAGSLFPVLIAVIGLAGCNSSSAPPPPAADSQPPTAPANLTATANGPSEIDLSWTASTDNVAVTAYRVERCQGAGCNNFAQIATPAGTAFNNTGLTASTSYSYRVRAADAAGNLSSFSGTATAITGPSAAGQTPTFVQAAESPMSNQNADNMALELLNGSQAGNCIVVAYWFVNSAAPLPISTSVSDDKGNPYTVVATFDGLHTRIQWAIASNVVVGARRVTITFSGGQAQKAQGKVMEFFNCAAVSPFDVASPGANGTGAVVTAGSFTPTADGELLIQLAVCDTTGTCNAGPGGSSELNSWTQGAAPWKLIGADLHDGTAEQYQVQTTAAAINPTLTMSPSADWTSHAIAIKSGSSGSGNPAGIRAVQLFNQRWAHNNAPNPEKFQIPNCQGNLIALFAFGTPGLDFISAPTDSNGNTWTQVGTGHAGETEGFFRAYYTSNPTCSPGMVVSIPFNALSNSGTNVFFWDIQGAATSSPLDVETFTNGDQTGVGNQTGVTITPTMSNGIVLTVMGVISNTVSGVVAPANGLFDAPIQSPIVTQNSLAENNGWAHYYNPNTSAITWIWGTQGGPLSNWGNWAIAFKAGP